MKNPGISEPTKPGTINIILHIDAALSPGALARALVTCTEAKTAAIQELLAPSRYSSGIATGSGTDGTILIANPLSYTYLTNAGKHCKLGEYIGRTVKKAVKEALDRQSGLNPAFQHNILNRMDRFGITEDSLWSTYLQKLSEKEKNLSPFVRAEFEDCLSRLCHNDTLVTYTSLYAHLMDQLDWGLLSPEETIPAGKQILNFAGFPTDAHCSCSDDQNPIANMADFYLQGLVELIMKQ